MDVRRALRRAHLRNIQPARHSALLSSGRTPSEPAQVGEAREGTSPSVAGAGVSVVKGGVRKAATCASVSGVGDASAADDAAAAAVAVEAAGAAGPAQKDHQLARLEDLGTRILLQTTEGLCPHLLGAHQLQQPQPEPAPEAAAPAPPSHTLSASPRRPRPRGRIAQPRPACPAPSSSG